MRQRIVIDAEQLQELLHRGSGELAPLLLDWHPADLAEMLAELDGYQQVAIFRLLPKDRAAEVLGELDPDLQTALVKALGREKAADIGPGFPS